MSFVGCPGGLGWRGMGPSSRRCVPFVTVMAHSSAVGRMAPTDPTLVQRLSHSSVDAGRSVEDRSPRRHRRPIPPDGTSTVPQTPPTAPDPPSQSPAPDPYSSPAPQKRPTRQPQHPHWRLPPPIPSAKAGPDQALTAGDTASARSSTGSRPPLVRPVRRGGCTRYTWRGTSRRGKAAPGTGARVVRSGGTAGAGRRKPSRKTHQSPPEREARSARGRTLDTPLADGRYLPTADVPRNLWRGVFTPRWSRA